MLVPYSVKIDNLVARQIMQSQDSWRDEVDELRSCMLRSRQRSVEGGMSLLGFVQLFLREVQFDLCTKINLFITLVYDQRNAHKIAKIKESIGIVS